MKTASILLALLGVGLMTAVGVWLGAGAVFKAMLSVGAGGFALLVGWQLLCDGVLALAWRTSCPRSLLRIGIGRLLLSRMVREGAMTCLPFSQIGGILIGMRATGFGGAIAWPMAVAANVIDLTTEVIGQIAFVLLGLLFLLDRKPDTDLAGPLGLGMLLAVAAMAGFIWVQRGAGGLFRRLARSMGDRVAAPALRRSVLDGIDSLQSDLDAFYARPGRIAGGCLIHLTGWLGGAAWVWMAYRLLGAPVQIDTALAIEGAASGIMAVSFLVPGALGVQEAAYVALGSLFGLDPHLSFGLSLLRRARDLAIGAPVLLLWQWVELVRLRRGAKTVSQTA
ncbi:lysylphosphatidylglycerol synthase domain-containing protein [Lichenicoccus roseus]|uniref:HpnL family protein n=1 Tax=Lichenicoccus roseus TaxID=2683649 RepID=A0A5R9J379_9PROT|nr:lysylphosphatidylglycerol synthase domain-containing protein [Lichenicoccus roseus]TLU72085.1 HpnL family protein [Lichenicoccus roseus]